MSKQKQFIFISYRSKDYHVALKIAADLKNAGINLWMDRLDIDPGEDWRKSIEQALSESPAIIALISNEYIASEYCRRELARADRLGKQIIPLLIAPIPIAEWPLEIERSQYIDFTGLHQEHDYQASLTTLIDFIQHAYTDQIGSTPDPETQYLTHLIVELESRRGLIGYMELSTDLNKWYEPQDHGLDINRTRSWSQYFRYRYIPDPTVSHVEASLVVSQYEHTIYDGIDELLSQHTRFVLLGPPGSGKSSTLYQRVLEAAFARRARKRGNPIPLLINLSSWDDDTNFYDFVRGCWPLESDPFKLLPGGRMVLYLDGLNELSVFPEAKIAQMREWLHADRAPKHVVITCRQNDYTGRFDLGLPTVHIETLDREQIRVVVENTLEHESAQIFLSRLMPPGSNWNRQTHYYLYHLARNPFLLSALLLLYKIRPSGEVPSNLAALLQEVASAIWEREFVDHAKSAGIVEEVEIALSDLASAIIEHSDNRLYFPYQVALEYMGNKELLEMVIQINFIERNAGHVRFTHQWMQDFCAARGFIRARQSPPVTKPRVDDSGHVPTTKWDNVIILYSGMTSDPDLTLLEIARVNPPLALRCIASGVNVSQTTIVQILQLLYDFTDVQGTHVAAAMTLSMLDIESSVPILLNAMRAGHWSTRWNATLNLWAIELPPLPGLTQTLSELETETEDVSIIGIQNLGESAIPMLIHLLLDDSWKIRRSAAWALGHLRDGAAVPALIHNINDRDRLVSIAALDALGQIRDTATIPTLVETLLHENWRIRRAAARSLGMIGSAAVHALLDAFYQGDADTRRLIVESFQDTANPLVATFMLEASYDLDADVRAATIMAFENLEEEIMIRRLIEFLLDHAPTRWFRKKVSDIAADNLAKSPSPIATEALRRHRSEPHTIGNLISELDGAPSIVNNDENGSSATQAKERLHNARDTSTSRQHIAVPTDEQIFHEDWKVRRRAVQELANSTAPTAIFRLRRAMRDNESRVRIAAARSLATLSDPLAVEVMVEHLSDTDEMVVQALVRELIALGSVAVIPLTNALSNTDTSVQAIILEILGNIMDPRAVEAISKMLNNSTAVPSKDQRLCDVAARALRTMNTPEAYGVLDNWSPDQEITDPIPAPTTESPLPFENHPEPEHDQDFDRAYAEHEAERQRQDILGNLLKSLKHPDWNTRHDAAKALGVYAKARHGQSASHITNRLIAALGEAESSAKLAIVEALAWLGDKSAVPIIETLLTEQNWTLKIGAIRALSELGQSGVMDELVRCLWHTNSLIREAAADALGVLGEKQEIAVTGLTKSLLDEEPFVRLAAVNSLGQIGNATLVPELVALLKDDETFVRWGVVQALGAIGSAESVPILIDCLNESGGPYWEERRICDVAADALEAMGTPQALRAVERWKKKEAASHA